MSKWMSRAALVAAVWSAFVFASPARAGVIVGGSALLDASALAQLETWLGEGPLTLTNIFTKQPGSTGADFHAAADGQGRTFTVMRATDDGVTAIIGGYNPVSWSSVSGFNLSPPNPMTAFIFNLTTATLKLQIAEYQTYNEGGYGPAFGGGLDIDVDSSLNLGYSHGHSYGVFDGRSLVSDQLYDGPNMTIAELEVFAIGAAIPAPEPGTLALLASGLAGVGLVRRRRRAPAR